jgi:hypothetical protein
VRRYKGRRRGRRQRNSPRTEQAADVANRSTRRKGINTRTVLRSSYKWSPKRRLARTPPAVCGTRQRTGNEVVAVGPVARVNVRNGVNPQASVAVRSTGGISSQPPTPASQRHTIIRPPGDVGRNASEPSTAPVPPERVEALKRASRPGNKPHGNEVHTEFNQVPYQTARANNRRSVVLMVSMVSGKDAVHGAGNTPYAHTQVAL